MDTENVPNVTDLPTTPVVPEPEKKKFYRNPKVVAGVVAGFIATGVAVAISGLRKNDSETDTDTAGEDDVTVETFEPIEDVPTV